MWLKSGSYDFLTEQCKNVFFSLRPVGLLSCSSIKLVKTVLTSLPFWTLCPNRLNLFGHFRINSVGHWKMPGKNYMQNYQRVPAESLKKGGPEVTVSRSPPLTSTPAHRGWWKRMEADNETGAWLVWVWLLHSAAGLRQGFFRKQVTRLGIISQLQIRSVVNDITIYFKK